MEALLKNEFVDSKSAVMFLLLCTTLIFFTGLIIAFSFLQFFNYNKFATESPEKWKSYAFDLVSCRKFLSEPYEDDFNDELSALDMVFIINSLWLPKYEKLTNYSCDQETFILEAQEREHSVAHAKLNFFLLSKFPSIALFQKILNTFTGIVMNSHLTLGWNALNEALSFYDDEGYTCFPFLRPILRDIFLWHFFEEFEHGVEFQYVYMKKWNLNSKRSKLNFISLGLLSIFFDLSMGLLFLFCTLTFATCQKRYSKLFPICTIILGEYVQRICKFTALIAIFLLNHFPSSEAIILKRNFREKIIEKYVVLNGKFAKPMICVESPKHNMDA